MKMPRENGFPRLRDPALPCAVATKVSRPKSFFHCVKNPSFRCECGLWPGTAGSGPMPVFVSWAPLMLVVPEVIMEVTASEACEV